MARRGIALLVALLCIPVICARSGNAAETVGPPTSPKVSGIAEHAITRAEFAQLVQKNFHLEAPNQPVTFPDVRSTDARYGAIEAAAPYMNEQILCPGCFLASGFFPDEPISRRLIGIAIVRILLSQNRIQLPTIAESERALANINGGAKLPRFAKPYLAAAAQRGFVLTDPQGLTPHTFVTHSDFDQILQNANQTRSLPLPPIK